MSISLAIDLVLVAVVALCGWRGFRAGIINGVSWIIAVIIAIYGANLVATAYYTEFTSMLEPFALGVVENVMFGDEEEPDEEDAEEARKGPVVDPSLSIDQRESLDVYTVAKEVMARLGIASQAAESIAAETADSCEKVNAAMAAELTELLCDRASFVAIFAIAFAIIAIVFTVIGNVFDFAFGIPGHENFNHVTGAALGVIRGLLIILVLGCLGRYAGLVLPGDTMQKTLLFKHLVETNRLAELLRL